MVADDASCRLKSLRDPSKKMSKSDVDKKSSILLTDKPDEILTKIKKSVTDFTSEVTFDPEKRVGVANLITIHSLMSGKTPEQICQEAKDLNTGQYKLIVADAVISHLTPIREDIERYMKDPEYLSSVIEEGNEKAMEVAEKTLNEVRHKVGLDGLRLASKSKVKNSVKLKS